MLQHIYHITTIIQRQKLQKDMYATRHIAIGSNGYAFSYYVLIFKKKHVLYQNILNLFSIFVKKKKVRLLDYQCAIKLENKSYQPTTRKNLDEEHQIYKLLMLIW